MSVYTLLWMFLIYGFAGWLFETVLTAIKTKKIVNKGFLQGPILVGYGIAPVLISSLLMLFEGVAPWITVPVTIFASFISVFLVEFLTVKLFVRIFGKTPWNRESLKNTIIKNVIYGAVLSLVMLFVQPLTQKLINATISHEILILLTGLAVLLMLDVIYSLSEGINIKTKISAAKELEAMLLDANSDDGIKIYAKPEFLGENRAEFDKKCAKYKRFIISNNFAYTRLNNAYPEIDQTENLKLLEDLRYMYYLLKKN